MPELPDLEVLKKRLSVLVGDTIASTDIHFPLAFRTMIEGEPEELLSGRTVKNITRRGKFLIFTLDMYFLVFNLMLTGRLHVADQFANLRNTRVVFTFNSGEKLYFVDFKKMGKIYITDTLEKIPQYQELGLEPLSDQFTCEKLVIICKDPREIKLVLTDQKLIAGIGNAYSDEILFYAQLNPRKKAELLTHDEVSRLYTSIQYILSNAVSEIETQLEESSGEIRTFFSVHGRKGQPCPVCGSVIREIEVARRITHICPTCQQVPFPW